MCQSFFIFIIVHTLFSQMFVVQISQISFGHFFSSNFHHRWEKEEEGRANLAGVSDNWR